MDIVERIRIYEIDHGTEGWPAIKMKEVSELADEIERLRAELDQLMAQKAKEHRGTNEYGLDVGYIAVKLNLFLRDIDRYTRDEAARALARLAITADESVLCEPEFTSTMPSQQSPVMAVPTGITVISGVLVDGCRIDFETVDGLFSDAFNGVLQAREYLYTSPSPRITEQDAREIVSILLDDYREEYCGQSIDSWIESCEELLLNKLNNKTAQEEK